MKTKLCIFGLLLCALAWLFQIANAPPSWAGADKAARVFMVHSYEQGHVCGQPQHDGILAALKKNGLSENGKLIIGAYYMDTKRRYNTPELIAKQAQAAIKALKEFKPDVLVTLDDNAFRTVGLKMSGTGLPVVFSGINGQPEDYNILSPFMETRARPGGNITGVHEKLHAAAAVKVHAKLFPGLQKVLFIVDDSPTGQAVYRQISLELLKAPIAATYRIVTARSWEHYKELILQANRDPQLGAIYPAALLLRDGAGRTFTAPEIFSWTTRHSTKPEIAVNYMFTRMGLFGGAAVDFFAMGAQAGDKVSQIIGGKDPGLIPIDDASRYALVFNLDRAQSLNIKIPDDVLLAADEVVSAKHTAAPRQ